MFKHFMIYNFEKFLDDYVYKLSKLSRSILTDISSGFSVYKPQSKIALKSNVF